MFKKEYVSFLCCPDCRASLSIKDKQFTCSICKNEYPLIGSIPVLVSSSMAKDVKLSREKWDAEYKKTVDKDKARSLKKNFKNIYLSSTMSYIEKLFDSYKNKKYLEIGCGPFFIGQEIATKGAFVVGIDYSMNALKLAKFYLDEEGMDNYLLVCGDIAKMPFKGDTFDLLYGGGVIEHFKDTVGVVKENYRVLKKGGVAFNSVPKLNLGSLTYRQMWGNIPSAPVLRQIAEFVHIKILKGKRMIYGYEYSFTDSQLRKIFAKAGFRREKVDVGRYEVPLLLEYIKNKIARKVALVVAKSDLFWPATYILSRK